MDRRQFIKGTASAVTTPTAVEGVAMAGTLGQPVGHNEAPQTPAGRPVRAVSIGFRPPLPLERMAELVEQAGSTGTDLIALPETCRGQNDTSPEGLDGPTITAMARLAGKHRTYIVCPIDRRDGERRLNSSVLLDRRGQIIGIYDKLYPYYEEFNKRPGVRPGQGVTVYQTDFGRVGLAVCFDVNWAPLWQRLSDLGAELVVWSSAYSAGRSLQARAIDFNYHIMSSTWTPDCLIYDIDGTQLVYDHENVAKGLNLTRFTFDLDRCLFHQDINLPKRLAKLIEERGADVEREKWLPMEGWFVLRAKRPGVSARELAKQYGLEERRPYINRSRCEIDKLRGWQFS